MESLKRVTTYRSQDVNTAKPRNCIKAVRGKRQPSYRAKQDRIVSVLSSATTKPRKRGHMAVYTPAYSKALSWARGKNKDICKLKQLVTTMLSLQKTFKVGWRDGPDAKNLPCPSKGPTLSSHHTQLAAYRCLLYLQGIWHPLLASTGICTHVAHTLTHIHTLL